MADRVRRSAADREAARQARMQRRAATTTLRERRQTGRRRGPRTAGVTGDRRILRRGLAVVPLILVVAAIWFLVELFQPFAGSGHGRVVVDIPRGAGTSRIGSTLARDGVVSSGFFFKLRAKLDGDGSKLLPGRHVMALGMSYSAALQVLTTPPFAL